MITSNLTKVFIKVGLKDYPVGKMMFGHFWLVGKYSKHDLENDKELKSFIKFSKEITDKYILDNYEIDYVSYCVSKPTNEKICVIIKDSVVELNKKSKILKNTSISKKVDLKSLKLYDYSVTDLDNLLKNLNIELFKRKFNLSDDEYNFYLKNQHINCIDIKEKYKSLNPSNDTSTSDNIKEKKLIIKEKLGLIKPVLI
jgi:hypothetical protein